MWDKRNALKAHQETNPTIYSAAFIVMVDLPPLSASCYNARYEDMSE
jgi:hypothetical protein